MADSQPPGGRLRNASPIWIVSDGTVHRSQRRTVPAYSLQEAKGTLRFLLIDDRRSFSLRNRTRPRLARLAPWFTTLNRRWPCGRGVGAPFVQVAEGVIPCGFRLPVQRGKAGRFAYHAYYVALLVGQALTETVIDERDGNQNCAEHQTGQDPVRRRNFGRVECQNF